MKFAALAGLVFVTTIGALPVPFALVAAGGVVIASCLAFISKRRENRQFAQSQTWLREQMARR